MNYMVFSMSFEASILNFRAFLGWIETQWKD